MNEEAIFWITNHHAEVPPAWVTGSTEGRRGYFENEYGEQWFARATQELFRFTGGDIGWRTVSISQPDYRRLSAALAESSGSQQGAFEGVILSPAVGAPVQRATQLSRLAGPRRGPGGRPALATLGPLPRHLGEGLLRRPRSACSFLVTEVLPT